MINPLGNRHYGPAQNYCNLELATNNYRLAKRLWSSELVATSWRKKLSAMIRNAERMLEKTKDADDIAKLTSLLYAARLEL